MNELPLRHVFTAIDGKTTGPNLYSGHIGKALEGCVNEDIVEFKQIAIPADFIGILTIIGDLSSDQKYLRDMILAIHNHYVPPSLAERAPGRLGYARWLTSANRILRIYVSQIVPSANLVLLTRFVINVYARSWFDIKYKSSFTDSPKHIFNMISRISEFDNALVTQICHRVISTNSYSLHSENILCTMLEDSDPLVRIIAANKIISIRATHLSSSLRKFIKPKINFSASNYYQLIDPDIDWLESVLTRHLSRDYLLSLAHRPHSFMYYPCHSQSVERHIRIVSETCKFVCDPDERDSRIAITIAERNVMPNFRSKQDYPI